MKNVNQVKLKEISDLQGGYAFKSSEFQELGIPLLRIGEIVSNRIVFNEKTVSVSEGFWKTHSKYDVRSGDILVALSGATTGKYAKYLHNFPVLLNQRVLRIRANPAVHANYLYYSMSLLKTKIEDQAAGAAQPNISPSDIAELLIPLPPLTIQKKIVQVLDKAQELIDLREQQLKLLDDLVQSVFYDMFGDPVTNSKGWEITKISDLLAEKTQNGLYVPKEFYDESGVGMVHMSDAFYGLVRTGGLKKVILSESDIRKYSLNSADLLLARRSLNFKGAAKPCLVPFLDTDIVYESSLIRLRPNQKKILTIFLFYYLSNKRVRGAFILKHVTKSTISGINNKGLNSIQVLMPPISLQNEFAEKVQKIEEQKTLMQESLQQMKDNYNSLMQRAFKGELFPE